MQIEPTYRPRVKLNIKIHRRFKAWAAERGLTIQEAVERAVLKIMLEEPRSPASTEAR